MQGRSKAKKLRFSEEEGGIYSQRGVKARGGRGRREAGREAGWRWGAACMTDACLALALELMVWAEFLRRDLLQRPRGPHLTYERLLETFT